MSGQLNRANNLLDEIEAIVNPKTMTETQYIELKTRIEKAVWHIGDKLTTSGFTTGDKDFLFHANEALVHIETAASLAHFQYEENEQFSTEAQ